MWTECGVHTPHGCDLTKDEMCRWCRQGGARGERPVKRVWGGVNRCVWGVIPLSTGGEGHGAPGKCINRHLTHSNSHSSHTFFTPSSYLGTWACSPSQWTLKRTAPFAQ